MRKLKHANRNQSGLSLPTLMMLGVVASMFMLATASLVAPAMVRISSERTHDMMRSSAEAGLDWAVDQLNSGTARGTIDAMQTGGSNTSNIPSNILSSSNFSGTVTVQNVGAPTYSSLYQTGLDSTQASSNITTGNGWRIVTATVAPNSGNNGGHSVRVILAPIYNTTQVIGPPQYYFNYSAFGGQSVSGNGNTNTNSYNSTTNPNPTAFVNQYGDIGTNGTVGLVGNASIGGNVNILSNGQNNGTATSNVTVYGSVTSDGTVSGFSNVGSGPGGGSISQNQSNPQQTLPSAPTAPAGSTNLGAISLSGQSSMTLTAGNYIVSSISIAGKASLNIDSSGGPVNIYVQGAGSNGGISIAGNGIINGGVPANLRLWYNGTGSTQIAGNGNFVGVVYAPNSPVSLSGNGSQYGAVVGASVNFNGNGAFHYDQALSNNNQFQYQTMQNAATISRWEAVSWEEW